MNRQTEDEMEIDLRDLFFALLGRVHVLILAFIMGALTLYPASIALLPKKYQSSTSIYVLNRQDNSVVTVPLRRRSSASLS